ncbi:CRISPR-associated protein, Cmr3 family [Armatimonadetes bacterium GBS]|jgi:CRISPR-associated protein Cmr3|nr:CRISPR-associated protein, Cmr3 family [Armatimonadetes bacterium GBS]CUU38815.1 CRISPR-associated protein, Cmr3 family [Armatimonadetes bacterium GXS]
MPAKVVQIEAFDPLLFRDGRPFAGDPGALNARSLPIPMPSTIAGFIRTFIGNQQGWNWKQDWQRAMQVKVLGPLLYRTQRLEMQGEFIFPAPADALVYNENGALRVAVLVPANPPGGSGCNLPHSGLKPLKVSVDTKPAGGYNFWKWSDMEQWLLGRGQPPSEQIEGLPRETRTHVAIDDKKGTSKEHHLFTVEYRAFEHLQRAQGDAVYYRWAMLARVELPEDVSATLDGVGTLGGERRAGFLHETQVWLECPETIRNALSHARKVRMVLATPAIFRDGWKPGWLNNDLQGTPPGTSVQLKLVGAAVKRHEAVSGWDYVHNRPKSVRWLAPAGSVYFFEIVDGSAERLTHEAWLQPMSDDEQDRNNGYGLALWGVWNDTDAGGNKP